MKIVSFMDIDETEEDLILSFALDLGEGRIQTLLLHRTLFYEFLLPEEERGTKVSLEGYDFAEGHLNILEYVTFDERIMKIDARFSSHVIDLLKLEIEDIAQIKEALTHHNFDARFEVKFI